MRYLIPVDGSENFHAQLDYLDCANRQGRCEEAILLNVQPQFDGVVSRYTSRAARKALRAEYSAAALVPAAQALARAGIPFRCLTATGATAERIAKAAAAEGADEIVLGTARHARWWRWISPSVTQELVDRTRIPVTVLARTDGQPAERNFLAGGIAGVAGIAAIVLFLAGNTAS